MKTAGSYESTLGSGEYEALPFPEPDEGLLNHSPGFGDDPPGEWRPVWESGDPIVARAYPVVHAPIYWNVEIGHVARTLSDADVALWSREHFLGTEFLSLRAFVEAVVLARRWSGPVPGPPIEIAGGPPREGRGGGLSSRVHPDSSTERDTGSPSPARPVARAWDWIESNPQGFMRRVLYVSWMVTAGAGALMVLGTGTSTVLGLFLFATMLVFWGGSGVVAYAVTGSTSEGMDPRLATVMIIVGLVTVLLAAASIITA